MKLKGINNFKSTKKLAGMVLAGTITAVTLTGCGNQDLWDSNYTFNYAVDINGDNAVIYDITKWGDYEGEQVQILTEGNEKDGWLGSTNNMRLYRYDNPELIEEIAQSLVGENGTVIWYENLKQKVKTK